VRKRVCVCVSGCLFFVLCDHTCSFFVAASCFWKQSLSSRLHSSCFFWAISFCDELLVGEEAATTGFCFLCGFFVVY
jgi:hypothetical protein